MFEDFKQRQAVVWGAAPFEIVAPNLAPMHAALVGALAPEPGERWLDVGCGTGDVAFLAARAGADVTASDLAPALVDTARRQAEEQELAISFEVADAEALPYPDGSFDIVSSSVGMIFAPDHPRAAAELTRVCRRGGRLGFTAWSPTGRIGDFFRVVGRFAPPPPDGAGNPLQWGDRAHVAELLGHAFDLSFQDLDAPLELESGEEGWETFLAGFGPIATLAAALPADRLDELHQAMVDLFEEDRAGEAIVHPRLFLLVSGVRR